MCHYASFRKGKHFCDVHSTELMLNALKPVCDTNGLTSVCNCAVADVFIGTKTGQCIMCDHLYL